MNLSSAEMDEAGNEKFLHSYTAREMKWEKKKNNNSTKDRKMILRSRERKKGQRRIREEMLGTTSKVYKTICLSHTSNFHADGLPRGCNSRLYWGAAVWVCIKPNGHTDGIEALTYCSWCQNWTWADTCSQISMEDKASLLSGRGFH